LEIIIGAVSLVTLFDSVVNCYEQVQVGKEFKESYERYLLQLKVSKLRLSQRPHAVAKLRAKSVVRRKRRYRERK
jgi:hypothetical protein